MSSPFDGRDDDPVTRWPTSDRIVCYCGCPHHLSSIRAAKLLSNGYEDVFVIDEGFGAWLDRGSPVAGESVDGRPEPSTVSGFAPAGHAGEFAFARHEPSGQAETAFIRDDGGYELELGFAGVTPDSPVVVETPAYAVTAPLAVLEAGVVVTRTGRVE